MQKEKRYKLFNYFLIFFMIVGSIIVGIQYFLRRKYFSVFTSFTIILTVLFPIFLKNTKFKLSYQDKFIYYIFIFLAQFLGGILNFYKRVSWFDVFTHFISGMVFCYIAFFIMSKLEKRNNYRSFIYFLYSMGVVALSAVLWEVVEYVGDLVLGTNLQHNIETGVNDTMEDMIVALMGGLIAYIILVVKLGKENIKKINHK